MSKLAKALTAAAGNAGGEALYVEDVFSTFLFTAKSGATENGDMVNGINLADEGGMVWIKDRTEAYPHSLIDTERGNTKVLKSDSTAAQSDTGTYGLLAFNTDGFELGTGGGAMWGRDSGNNKVATWTFRKAEKFFDVVTYTGNGTTQEISHNLGVAPAFIIVKETSTTRDWVCYHSALGETYRIFLNASNAAINSSSAIVWGNNTTAVAPTDSVFTIGNAGVVNESGGTYVAYLFASDAGGFGDDGSESIIKCGTFSMPGTSFADVDVGFEPQWVLLKDYNHTQSWTLIDTMRGLSATTGGANGASGNLARLWANLSYAESPAAQGGLTSTGFTWPSNWNYGDGNTDYIYIAIRRPMKTPESGTEVFSPLTSSSSAGTKLTTGFPIDMQIAHDRTGSLGIVAAVDRLRGVKTTSGAAYTTPALNTVAANPESSDDYSRGWDNEGFEIIGSFAYGSTSTAYWNFKRATGFFDVVAYTGNGVAGRTVAHNLGVVPELMIVKSRGSARQWVTYDSTNGATGRMNLDDNGPWGTGLQYWNNTAPTDSVFTLGTQYDVNQSSIAYVNYLFASVAGVSKVGSYTGNGTTQNIDCGFSAGARFVLIKRTDAAENWHIFDTERGITSGNDPALRLDTNVSEFTSAAINPYSAGFQVEQSASCNNNVSGGTYIFLAIA